MEKLSVFVVTLAVLCVYMQVSNSCKSRRRSPPPKPPLCHWTTCLGWSWSAWSNSHGVKRGACVLQKREKIFRVKQHSQRGGCPKVDPCVGVPETRFKCKCVEFKIVEAGWTNWRNETEEDGRICRKRTMRTDLKKTTIKRYGINACPDLTFPEVKEQTVCSNETLTQ